MCTRLSKYHLAIFSVLCTLSVLFLSAATGVAQQTGISYQIDDIKTSISDDALAVTFQGNSPPAFTTRTLYDPLRLVMDIANVELGTKLNLDSLIPNNKIVDLHTTVLSNQTPQITRFEFQLKGNYQHKVERKDNNLLVNFTSPSSAMAADVPGATLQNISFTTSPTETKLFLEIEGPLPDYRDDVLAANGNLPPRMFLDINNLNATKLAREKYIGSVIDRVRVATRGSGVRLVFESDSKEMFAYHIDKGAKGLSVTVIKKALIEQMKDTSKKKPKDATLEELIDLSEAAAKNKNLVNNNDSVSTSQTAASMENKFQFSGYNKKRISVDFYKIDLHNVFRLFRQISDLNLIVDESVKGTLTLALNDVPWDFALDIILNLTDLNKEERFNTIVIYPKSKAFVWPERSEDNLSFEADIEIVEQEALIIQQSANQPKEIMLAKEFMRKAKAKEKQGDFEDAADLYKQAFQLWPSNNKLANRLSNLYLVSLGINAKAVYYAKKSLEIKATDTAAALTAAIGYANMEQIPEATEYFSQSISGSPPMKEALLSYAAFNETNNRFEAAIKILDKYHTFYGESVDTMVAKGRIYEKLKLHDKAIAQYKLLFHSGFPLRPDLKKYIEQQIAQGK